MEFNPVVITVAGVILLVLGIGAGWLLGSVGTDEGEPEPGSAEPAPPGGRKGRYTPVAKLWREKKTGTLVVEMDGKAYTAVEGLNEIQRERLEKSARELRVFLGMGLAGADELEPAVDNLVQEEPAAPPPAPARTAAPASALPPASAASASVVTPAVSRPANPVPARPVARPVTRPTPPPPATVRSKEEIASPAAKSIVMQIEDILQDMIVGTPLANRGLHLTEDPIRGVIVQLGLQYFEGIDAVTDPEAKAAIRAAVQTWERSQ